jgi:hypothetical protein
VSCAASVKLNDEQFQQQNISTIIVAGKSPAVIAKYPCFMIEDYIEKEIETGKNFTINVYLKIKKILSIILITISKNFYMFCNHPHLYLLSAEDFKLFLKHKRF